MHICYLGSTADYRRSFDVHPIIHDLILMDALAAKPRKSPNLLQICAFDHATDVKRVVRCNARIGKALTAC